MVKQSEYNWAILHDALKKQASAPRTNREGKRESVPALTPEDAAFLSPFFLMMKLAPMKRLEESASTRPLMLSADMPVYHLPPPEAEAEAAAVEVTSIGRAR